MKCAKGNSKNESAYLFFYINVVMWISSGGVAVSEIVAYKNK